MESQDLVRQTVHGLYMFLKQMSQQKLLGMSEDELDTGYRRLKENWEHVWIELRDWLSRTELNDKHSTLLNFTQRFAYHIAGLDDSIYLHEELWNLVFGNLKEAQKLLLESQ